MQIILKSLLNLQPFSPLSLCLISVLVKLSSSLSLLSSMAAGTSAHLTCSPAIRIRTNKSSATTRRTQGRQVLRPCPSPRTSTSTLTCSRARATPGIIIPETPRRTKPRIRMATQVASGAATATATAAAVSVSVGGRLSPSTAALFVCDIQVK